MRGRRFEALARAIERRFPGSRVVVDRYTPPDHDRGIRWFVRILNCPARLTPHAHEFAVRRAIEIWGGIGYPFFVGAYDRRVTREHFADRFAGSLRGRGRSRRAASPSTADSRRTGRRTAG